jgi:hypothetical protein
MFKALEPFRKDVVVDEPNKDTATAVSNVFSCHKNQHKEPLKDLGIPVMTLEEFWEDGDKDYNEFAYGKSLVTKQVHAKLMWPLRRLHEWYYLACVCGLQSIEGLFLKQFSRVEITIYQATHYLSTPNARHYYDDRLLHVSVSNIS